MSKIKSIEVQCLHCEKWNRSQFVWDDTDDFTPSDLTNCRQTCIYCGKLTSSNYENFRIRIEGEDTYHGIDTYFN